jgi:hypothetical protein
MRGLAGVLLVRLPALGQHGIIPVAGPSAVALPGHRHINAHTGRLGNPWEEVRDGQRAVQHVVCVGALVWPAAAAAGPLLGSTAAAAILGASTLGCNARSLYSRGSMPHMLCCLIGSLFGGAGTCAVFHMLCCGDLTPLMHCCLS